MVEIAHHGLRLPKVSLKKLIGVMLKLRSLHFFPHLLLPKPLYCGTVLCSTLVTKSLSEAITLVSDPCRPGRLISRVLISRVLRGGEQFDCCPSGVAVTTLHADQVVETKEETGIPQGSAPQHPVSAFEAGAGVS